jgi:hypothetical protein
MEGGMERWRDGWMERWRDGGYGGYGYGCWDDRDDRRLFPVS